MFLLLWQLHHCDAGSARCQLRRRPLDERSERLGQSSCLCSLAVHMLRVHRSCLVVLSLPLRLLRCSHSLPAHALLPHVPHRSCKMLRRARCKRAIARAATASLTAPAPPTANRSLSIRSAVRCVSVVLFDLLSPVSVRSLSSSHRLVVQCADGYSETLWSHACVGASDHFVCRHAEPN